MFRNTLRMGRFLVFSFLMAAFIGAPSVIARGALVAAERAWEAGTAPGADASSDAVALAQADASGTQTA